MTTAHAEIIDEGVSTVLYLRRAAFVDRLYAAIAEGWPQRHAGRLTREILRAQVQTAQSLRRSP